MNGKFKRNRLQTIQKVALVAAETTWMIGILILASFGVSELICCCLGVLGGLAIFAAYRHFRAKANRSHSDSTTDKSQTELTPSNWGFKELAAILVMFIACPQFFAGRDEIENTDHLDVAQSAPKSPPIVTIESPRSSTHSASPKVPSKRGWGDSRQKENRPAGINPIPPKKVNETSSAKTAEYWNATVEVYFQLVFDSPEPGNAVGAAVKGHIEKCRVVADQIEAMETGGVDASLTEMVGRHVLLMRDTSRWASEALSVKEMVADLNKKVTDKYIESGIEMLQSLNWDPEVLNGFDDPKARQLAERAIELQGRIQDAFHEVARMQAALQERYRDQEFALPELVNLISLDPEWATFQKQIAAASARRISELRRFSLAAKPENTLNYWNGRVVPLYVARYEVTEKIDLTLETHEQLLTLRIIPEIDKMMPMGDDHVDVEVIEMAERHLATEVDLNELWNSEGLALASDYGINVPGSSASDSPVWKDKLIIELNSRRDTGLLTERERQFLEACYTQIRLREAQFTDVVVLQSRLNERYKGHVFPLQ